MHKSGWARAADEAASPPGRAALADAWVYINARKHTSKAPKNNARVKRRERTNQTYDKCASCVVGKRCERGH